MTLRDSSLIRVCFEEKWKDTHHSIFELYNALMYWLFPIIPWQNPKQGWSLRLDGRSILTSWCLSKHNEKPFSLLFIAHLLESFLFSIQNKVKCFTTFHGDNLLGRVLRSRVEIPESNTPIGCEKITGLVKNLSRDTTVTVMLPPGRNALRKNYLVRRNFLGTRTQMAILCRNLFIDIYAD